MSERPAWKVIVAMPALNAAQTLEETVASIPSDWVDEVILVDDHSSDDTVELARSLPIRVVWHPYNAGYGANQETCFLYALQNDADAVVMLHPDGQYDPSLIPAMVAPILNDEAGLVLGSRLPHRGLARKNGMPLWKCIANRFLTTLENAVMGTELTEAHTGYRACSRKMLMTIPFLRNSLDVSFDSEVIMQAASFGLRIKEVPADDRHFEEASSVGFQAGAVYGLKTLWMASRLVLHTPKRDPAFPQIRLRTMRQR